ncbi:hypothetical protein [Runella slithyformis]|uniref:hypothetical protein n=1 Tax=Runella slithyformis TaxID=106 RepID=UPI00059C4D7F|nr:hypothetical protein [Runella slithyformis]
MNNCNSCGTGQGKTEIWEPYGGSCEKLQQCKSNAKNKRNAAKNQAEALFIAELVLCGADALAAGGYVAGGSAILGPGSLLAGVATTLVVDIGCMSLAAYVYHNRTREIDADYQHMIWECESMFPC